MGVLKALSLDFIKRHFPRLYESLHLNLLRGQLNLTNVDVPSTDVFNIFSFPLYLSSAFISSLTLHIPWTHLATSPIRLTTENVQINLKEPEQSAQHSVFDAFIRESIHVKKTSIVDSHSTVTPFIRALHKLLPLLLHRIELDLRDIQLSIQFANKAVVRLSLSVVTTHAPLQSTADLAKSFIINDLSVQISVSPCRPLNLSFSQIELALTLVNARYDVDIVVPRPVSLSVHVPSLLSFFAHVTNSRTRWNAAFEHDRPDGTVSKDPAAWFRYAVRVVRSSTGVDPHLTEEHAVLAMRKCVQYEKLHVRRLQKQLRPSDEEEINALELELDVDMIVMLRTYAGTKVLAEQVSSFSTTSWIRWTLFGSSALDQEREKLASEIRASFSAINKVGVIVDYKKDNGSNSDVMDQTSSGLVPARMSWSRARVSVRLDCFDVSLTGIGHDIRGKVSNAVVRAEAESDLDYYSLSMRVGDVVVHEGDIAVFRRGFIANGDEDVSERSTPIFSILVNKPALDQRVNLTGHAQPFFLVIGLYSVRRWLQFGEQCLSRNNQLFLTRPNTFSLLNNSRNTDSTRSQYSSVGKVPQLNCTANFSQIEVLVFDSLEASSGCADNALLLRLRGIGVQTQPSTTALEARVHADVVVKMCTLKRHTDENGFDENVIVDISDAFHLQSNITGSFLNNCISVSLDRSKVKANISSTESLLELSNAFALLEEDYTSMSNLLAVDSSSATKNNCLPINPSIECHVDMSSLDIELFHRLRSAVLNAGLLFHFSNVRVSHLTMESQLFVKELFVTEMVHGGRICVYPMIGRDHAVTVKFVKYDAVQGMPTMTASVGETVVSTPLQSLVKTSVFATRVYDLLEASSKTRQSKSQNLSQNQTAPKTSFRTSADVQSVRVELASPHRLCVELKRVKFFGRGNPVLNISCDDIRLWDDTRDSRNSIDVNHVHKLTRRIESRVVADERAVSVSIGPDHINAQLSHIQFTITHSLLRRLENIVNSLSLSSSSTLQQDEPELIRKQTNGKRTAPSPKRFRVRSSNVSLQILEQPSLLQGVRFDIPQATAVFSTNSQIISLQKLSVLTRTKPILNQSTSKETAASSVSVTISNETNQHKAPPTTTSSSTWRVLLRNLDADISHHYACTNEHTDRNHSCSYKDSWSVTILSRVIIFLAPSQVNCLTNVFTQLLQEAHENNEEETPILVSPTAVGDSCVDCFDDIASVSSSKNKSTKFPMAESLLNHDEGMCTSEISLHCETHALSVELFTEDIGGCVSSTVASVELDPVLLSLKTVNELIPSNFQQSGNIIRSITTWRATCSAFRLEDRGVDTPESRQIVVETEESWIGLHGSSSRLLQHEDANMGLSVEGLVRMEDGRVTSSHQVELKRARVLLSSRLHAAIVDFINRCTVDPSSKSKSRRSLSSLETEGKSKSNADPDDGTLSPTSKLSILLVDPVVLLFSVGSDLGESVFQIRAGLIKGSLLFSENGQLMPGSVIRIRRGHLFLLWMADTVNENEGNSADPLSPGTLIRQGSVGRLMHTNRHFFKQSHDYTLTNDENINENDFTQRNSSEAEVESVLDVKSVTVRLPVGDQRHFSIVVPNVVVQASLSTIQNAIKLSTCLDLGIPNDPKAPVICPELRISVAGLSASIKVPTRPSGSADSKADKNCGTSGYQFNDLSVNVACEIFVANNVEFISGEVKLSADVNDSVKKISDQVISPSILNFKLTVIDQISLDFWSDHFVRLTLSPLTARTITGIALSLVDNNGINNGQRRQQQFGGNGETVGIAQIGVRVSFRGIMVYCVAEEPRVQILRLVLHAMKIRAVIPFEMNDDGVVELSLQDLVVEDTVSWTLPWRHGEMSNSAQWTKLVAGNHGGFRRGSVLWMSMQHVADGFKEASRKISRVGRRTGVDGEGEWRGSFEEWPRSESRSGMSPLVSCVFKWVSPWEQVTAKVGVKGLDFNIDLGMLPSILEWGQSILCEFNVNPSSSPSPSPSPSSSSSSSSYPHSPSSTRSGLKRGTVDEDLAMAIEEELRNVLNIRIDYVLIEPIDIRVCIRAPPKRLEEGVGSWVLGKLLWNAEEFVDGVEIEFPRVVFNGNFIGIDRVFERVEALYVKAVTSRYLVKQVMWQLPRFARMARVVGTAMLRRRRDDTMVTTVESAALSIRGTGWNRGRGVGLLALLKNDDIEGSEEDGEDWRRIGNGRTGVFGRGMMHQIALLDYGDGGCQTGLLGHHGENPSGGAVQVLDITGGQ